MSNVAMFSESRTYSQDHATPTPSHDRILCRLIHHDLAYKAAEIHNTEIKEKETHSRLQGAISNSILSIGDLFKDLRDGSKSVKFPERLLRVLEQKLQDIAMRKDPVYVLVDHDRPIR